MGQAQGFLLRQDSKYLCLYSQSASLLSAPFIVCLPSTCSFCKTFEIN